MKPLLVIIFIIKIFARTKLFKIHLKESDVYKYFLSAWINLRASIVFSLLRGYHCEKGLWDTNEWSLKLYWIMNAWNLHLLIPNCPIQIINLSQKFHCFENNFAIHTPYKGIIAFPFPDPIWKRFSFISSPTSYFTLPVGITRDRRMFVTDNLYQDCSIQP